MSVCGREDDRDGVSASNFLLFLSPCVSVFALCRCLIISFAHSGQVTRGNPAGLVTLATALSIQSRCSFMNKCPYKHIGHVPLSVSVSSSLILVGHFNTELNNCESTDDLLSEREGATHIKRNLRFFIYATAVTDFRSLLTPMGL